MTGNGNGNGNGHSAWQPAAGAFAQPATAVRPSPRDLAAFVRWLDIPASRRAVLTAPDATGLRQFLRPWSTADMGALLLASEEVAAFVALSLFFTDPVQSWLEVAAPDVRLDDPRPDMIVEGVWRFATADGPDDESARERMREPAVRLLRSLRDLANETRTHPADIVGLLVALPVLNPAIGDPARVNAPASVQSVLGLTRRAVPALDAPATRRILGALHAARHHLRASHWPILEAVATAVSQVIEDVWRGPVYLTDMHPWDPPGDTRAVHAVEVVSLQFEMATALDADGQPQEWERILHESGSLAVDELAASEAERAGGLLETPAGRIWLCEGPDGGLFLAADREPARDLFRNGTASPVDAAVHGVDVNYPLVGFTF